MIDRHPPYCRDCKHFVGVMTTYRDPGGRTDRGHCDKRHLSVRDGHDGCEDEHEPTEERLRFYESMGVEYPWGLNPFAVRYRDCHLVLIHGDCPHPRSVANAEKLLWSIDQVADRVARDLAFHEVRRRPVDRALDGPWPAAGPRRNARMIEECVRELAGGAAVEVAGFPHPRPDKSPGTLGCLKLAAEAGLEQFRGGL